MQITASFDLAAVSGVRSAELPGRYHRAGRPAPTALFKRYSIRSPVATSSSGSRSAKNARAASPAMSRTGIGRSPIRSLAFPTTISVIGLISLPEPKLICDSPPISMHLSTQWCATSPKCSSV